METLIEKIPNPKQLEKEIGEFLTKRFGGDVKVISPLEMPRELADGKKQSPPPKKESLRFDMKPEELIAYLDQFIVRQDQAKAVLSTKICTHFNRIQRTHAGADDMDGMVGRIKNNVLMIGPTGVGKTYLIKLIARKIGVPFVKGDATKFSETGYVGGDVEDLVRELVREADGDIDLAENGIIYIDEVDKIASSHNLVGADISRTGVQRALLKPMEETEVDLKVPHDPISMIQEIEQFRKTGKRDRKSVNTRNILFIMSGAFSDMGDIIRKRLTQQKIGFGANVNISRDNDDILKHVRSEDLTAFGFESEFIGRLPVTTVLEKLTLNDLYEILINPNNPVILSKKLDFAAYGIDIKFSDSVLKKIADGAYQENTGARGLVSAIERTLLPFETRMPSLTISLFPVMDFMIADPEKAFKWMETAKDGLPNASELIKIYEKLADHERDRVRSYIESKAKILSEKYHITLTKNRMDVMALYYARHITDVESLVRTFKDFLDEIKKIELLFYKNQDINLVLEEDAIDYLIEEYIHDTPDVETIYQTIAAGFEYGLKLVREKTGKNRFFITRDALTSPDNYIKNLLKNGFKDLETI